MNFVKHKLQFVVHFVAIWLTFFGIHSVHAVTKSQQSDACIHALTGAAFKIYHDPWDREVNITGIKVSLGLEEEQRVKSFAAKRNKDPLDIAADIQSSENAWDFKQKGFMPVVNAIDQYSMIAEGLNEWLLKQLENADLPTERNGRIEAALDKLKNTIVKTLDKAIEQNAVVSDVVVFRGEHFTPDKLLEYLNGKPFIRKGFCSTSKNKRTAMEFAKKVKPGEIPVLFRIHLKRGQSALDFVGYVDSDATVNKHEQEVLLPRNLEFRIIGSGTENSMQILDIEIIK